MDATSKTLEAITRAARELGEAECTVIINSIPVTVHVPELYLFESPVGKVRFPQLGVLPSKPTSTGVN